MMEVSMEDFQNSLAIILPKIESTAFSLPLKKNKKDSTILYSSDNSFEVVYRRYQLRTD